MSDLWRVLLAVVGANMALLLIIAPLCGWGPQPHNRIIRFLQDHVFGLGVAEAAFWLALFGLSFLQAGDGLSVWLWRAVTLAFAAIAIRRATRHSGRSAAAVN